MSTKIEARRCSEKTDTQSCTSGQRYEIAAKAVFADLGRCSEYDKTKNFESDLIATEPLDKSSGNLDVKRRGRDQWWPGQWWPSTQWGGYYDHHNGNGGYHGGRRGAMDPGGRQTI